MGTHATRAIAAGIAVNCWLGGAASVLKIDGFDSVLEVVAVATTAELVITGDIAGVAILSSIEVCLMGRDAGRREIGGGRHGIDWRCRYHAGNGQEDK